MPKSRTHENFNPISALDWNHSTGTGTLRGSKLKFRLNEFGTLELVEHENADTTNHQSDEHLIKSADEMSKKVNIKMSRQVTDQQTIAQHLQPTSSGQVQPDTIGYKNVKERFRMCLTCGIIKYKSTFYRKGKFCSHECAVKSGKFVKVKKLKTNKKKTNDQHSAVASLSLTHEKDSGLQNTINNNIVSSSKLKNVNKNSLIVRPPPPDGEHDDETSKSFQKKIANNIAKLRDSSQQSNVVLKNSSTSFIHSNVISASGLKRTKSIANQTTIGIGKKKKVSNVELHQNDTHSKSQAQLIDSSNLPKSDLTTDSKVAVTKSKVSAKNVDQMKVKSKTTSTTKTKDAQAATIELKDRKMMKSKFTNQSKASKQHKQTTISGCEKNRSSSCTNSLVNNSAEKSRSQDEDSSNRMSLESIYSFSEQDLVRQLSSFVNSLDPNEIVLDWNSDRVSDFVSILPECLEYAPKFKEQNVDGESFLLLTQNDLINILEIKLYAALKLYDVICQIRNNLLKSKDSKIDFSSS